MSDLFKLRLPFPENQISTIPKHGVKLSYVGHAALTDRLLDVDPLWTWEPLALGADGTPVFDENGGMWIKLTVCGVTRLGYGDSQGKTGGNAVKEAIGDALRNAAMRFGCALDLWHKGDLHAHDESFSEPVADNSEFNNACVLTFLDGLSREDDLCIKEMFDQLTNEQREEVWACFVKDQEFVVNNSMWKGSAVRKAIKDSLARSK